MHTYETVFITPPILSEDEENSLVGGMAQVVTEGGGQLVANERMGRRRMAYPINKFEDGVYTRLLYDAEPEVPKELERRFGLQEKVLRHLTVRLEPDWAVAAKEQAVRDAKARAEAAALAKQREAEERAREEEKQREKEAQAADAAPADTSADEPATTEPAPAADGEQAPTADPE